MTRSFQLKQSLLALIPAFFHQRTVFGRTFFISVFQDPQEWELSDDEKTLLGYRVQKATTTHQDQLVVAWYAPELPFPVRAEQFGGLPGIILALSLPEDEITYTANRIEFDSTLIIELYPNLNYLRTKNCLKNGSE